jgi:hypothetical protein
MLLNAIEHTYNLQLLTQNGGLSTYRGWEAETEVNKAYWKAALEDLPIVGSYENKDGIQIHLSHAGYSCYNGKSPSWNRHRLLWDREHFFDEPGMLAENVICVHGHTPIQYLAEDLWLPEPPAGSLWYANNHKVCIDNASFLTGKTCLLDLDSFETIVFEGEQLEWA